MIGVFDIRIYWIWLVLVFKAGNPRIWQLSEKFARVDDFVRALQNGNVVGLNDSEKSDIKKHTLKSAEKLLGYCDRESINVYCYESEGYPEKLRRISNPPPVLFCYGNLDFLNDRVCIAVVGTRKPSEYSVISTKKICEQLVDRNILLSSGFANGIDRIANEISLEKNIPSVAVTGSAIEDDYPKGSDELKRLVSRNGAVISEYCSGIKALPNSFVRRNRILVGISDGVLFCECSDKSKGLDNANHASVQGKPIFVLPPHDIFDARYFGQRNLLRNGAVAVFDAFDIARNLAYSELGEISFSDDFENSVDSLAELEMKPSKKKKRGFFNRKSKKEKPVNTQPKLLPIEISKLGETKQKIYKALENENLHVDEIILKTGEDVATVLSELIELELEGMIVAYPGKIYGLAE